PALTGITGQGPLPRARLRLCFPVSPLYRCAAPYRHEKPGQLTAVARRGATGLCETLRPSGSGAPRRLGGVPGECPIFGLACPDVTGRRTGEGGRRRRAAAPVRGRSRDWPRPTASHVR